MEKFEAAPGEVSPSDSFVQYDAVGRCVKRRDVDTIVDTIVDVEAHSASEEELKRPQIS